MNPPKTYGHLALKLNKQKVIFHVFKCFIVETNQYSLNLLEIISPVNVKMISFLTLVENRKLKW